MCYSLELEAYDHFFKESAQYSRQGNPIHFIPVYEDNNGKS
jgi:hypothetical protein